MRSPADLARLVPGLGVARRYERPWLRHDVAAGLVLTALLVPQGMAYAELAGLPPVVGIYATMLPLLAYAVFGPSRILVLGPDSAVAPVVAAAVIPIAGDDPAERVALASLLALVVGALCIAGGIARLGILTDLISKPVRVGYLAGIAVVVLVDQVPQMLGLDGSGDDFMADVEHLATTRPDIELAPLAIGVASFAVIIACKRLAPQIPGALIAVVGSIAVVSALDPAGVATLGLVPEGLPALALPDTAGADLGEILLPALAIALVAFADTSVLSRSYASKLGHRVDQNQELAALGTANVAASLFQGFPISSSSSRTPVAEAAGARTQLAGVVAAIALGVVLVVATGLFENLPLVTLSAVIVAAVLGLIDVRAFRFLRRVDPTEFRLAIAAALGVALLGVLPGIGVAVGLSVLNLLWRAWHPYTAVLARVNGLKGYHDLRRHPEGRSVPGLLLFRFDAPLIFANADVFRDGVLRAVERAAGPIRRVVVAAEPITDLDSTAAEAVAALHGQLRAQGVTLTFAELKDPVKDKLARHGLLELVGPEHVYPTIGAAVHAYVDEHDVPWHDWEDALEKAEDARRDERAT
jgi:high affinity sulfate transporter 1